MAIDKDTRANDAIQICRLRHQVDRSCRGCVLEDSRICNRLKFVCKVDRLYKIKSFKGGLHNERFKEDS